MPKDDLDEKNEKLKKKSKLYDLFCLFPFLFVLLCFLGGIMI